MRYISRDGREWEVTLDAPGKVLSVAPELERSGALLPEHQIQIVFASGEERFAEEYTELAALEDLSEDELEEWLQAAIRGKGV
ncbi:MAG TPA: hypothetical protein VFZ18_15845 [Longimicrobiaceae bacterium]